MSAKKRKPPKKPFAESDAWGKVKSLLSFGLRDCHCALDREKLTLPNVYQARLERVERPLSDTSYVMTQLPLAPEGCITVVPHALWQEYLRYRTHIGYTASELREYFERPMKIVKGHKRWGIPFSLGEWAGIASYIAKPDAKRQPKKTHRNWADHCVVKAGTVWIEIWEASRWNQHRKWYQHKTHPKLESHLAPLRPRSSL